MFALLQDLKVQRVIRWLMNICNTSLMNFLKRTHKLLSRILYSSLTTMSSSCGWILWELQNTGSYYLLRIFYSSLTSKLQMSRVFQGGACELFQEIHQWGVAYVHQSSDHPLRACNKENISNYVTEVKKKVYTKKLTRGFWIAIVHRERSILFWVWITHISNNNIQSKFTCVTLGIILNASTMIGLLFSPSTLVFSSLVSSRAVTVPIECDPNRVSTDSLSSWLWRQGPRA